MGDNGSTDGSQEIAGALGARVASIEKHGYNFAVFTEVFAVTRGLLPQDFLSKVFRHLKLETCLLGGMALLLVGGGIWIAGLRYSSSMHFGPLNPATVLRIVIPGIVCLTLGFQVILSSFFLSVLGMRQQDRQ